MKVGYYQFRPVFGHVRQNLVQIVSALQDVKADLIVLPELALSGYYFQDRQEVKTLSEDPGNSSAINTLIDLCKAKKLYMVVGIAEKAKDKYFNSSLLLGPQGIIHTYRKLHLFNEEKLWFDPGDTPLEVHHVSDAKVGMMICFDWIFPEVTRTLAVMGADIIAHPSNLVLQYCQQTMLSRCLENAVFAITANRFGADKRPHGELKFTGKSQVVAPKGELLNRSASQRRDLFLIDIDPGVARNKQLTAHNKLMSDRRPEFYMKLTEK